MREQSWHAESAVGGPPIIHHLSLYAQPINSPHSCLSALIQIKVLYHIPLNLIRIGMEVPSLQILIIIINSDLFEHLAMRPGNEAAAVECDAAVAEGLRADSVGHNQWNLHMQRSIVVCRNAEIHCCL